MKNFILFFIIFVFVLDCKRNGEIQSPEIKISKIVKFERPPIIDAHTHLSPFAIPLIVHIMKTNNIDIMINFSGGSHGKGLEESIKLQEKLQGKVFNMYNIDWDLVDEPDFALTESLKLEDAVSRGFVGLKISKALGLYVKYESGVLVDVDDPVLDPVWETSALLEIPVAIHVADPEAFWKPPDESNERFKELQVHPYWSNYNKPVPSFWELLHSLENVFRRHPLTKFIAVHFGNCAEHLDYVASLLDKYPNVYIDIAARVPEIGRHPAEKVREFFIKYQDRILFGTDIGISPYHLMLGSSGEDEPTLADAKKFFDAIFRFLETNEMGIEHPTAIQGDWKIDAIGLPPGVLQKIYRKNAEKLFFEKIK